MGTDITAHTLPGDYLREGFYEDRYAHDPRLMGWDTDKGSPAGMCAKAQMLQSLLDKWDRLMNDPEISDGDKAMFKALFNGKMNALEQGEGGLSCGEGFDDILAALESGDGDALDNVLLDTVDMDQLFEAFGTAYQAATQITNIKPETDDDRLAKMFMTNDWDGLTRYDLEHKEKDEQKKA